MTRTVNGERLFDDRAKEVLRKHLWQAADFCGVEILTYAILSNHFHVLLGVPDREETVVSDEELMRRYRVLYPKPTKYQQAQVEVLEARLKEGGEAAVSLRERLLNRMGDVSEFMKTVKQRFSVWFNRSHGRYGTLWAERFKSVLVEPSPVAMKTVAAYIDLNPIRAGLVEDPKDYRWSGYGEAIGGEAKARGGICRILGIGDWSAAQSDYRMILYGKGATRSGEGGSQLSHEAVRAELKRKGQLPMAVALRCRVKYFTDGAVLGSQRFVAEWIEKRDFDRARKRPPKPKSMVGANWGGLAVLRQSRDPIVGNGPSSVAAGK